MGKPRKGSAPAPDRRSGRCFRLIEHAPAPGRDGNAVPGGRACAGASPGDAGRLRLGESERRRGPGAVSLAHISAAVTFERTWLGRMKASTATSVASGTLAEVAIDKAVQPKDLKTQP